MWKKINKYVNLSGHTHVKGNRIQCEERGFMEKTAWESKKSPSPKGSLLYSFENYKWQEQALGEDVGCGGAEVECGGAEVEYARGEVKCGGLEAPGFGYGFEDATGFFVCLSSWLICAEEKGIFPVCISLNCTAKFISCLQSY